jgi:hypothetical protein
MTVSIVRLLRRGCLVTLIMLGGSGMVRLGGGFVVFGGFRMSRFHHGISPSFRTAFFAAYKTWASNIALQWLELFKLI